jgi:glycosyltransferase involved in cell wall biosynthesis
LRSILCPIDFDHYGAINLVRREVCLRLDREKYRTFALHLNRREMRQWKAEGSFLGEYDILQTDMSYLPYLLLKARRLRMIHVHTVHSIRRDEKRRNQILNASLYKAADTIIAISNFVRKMLKQLYNVKSKRIYCGVDVNFFSPLNRDEAIIRKYSLKEPTVLFVGRLVREKRPDMVLKIARKLRDAFFVVAGDGPLLPHLKRQAMLMDLRNVAFTEERLKRDALKKLYASSNVFLFPSEGEGFGLATVEAMSSGLPVVSVLSGATPEIVSHGGDGFLTRASDLHSLTKYCRYLADNPSECRKMGREGRKKMLESLSWNLIAHQYEELYDSLG